MSAHGYTYAHMDTHAHTWTYMCAHGHTCTHMDVHACTWGYMLAHGDTCSHMDIHAHTWTYTYILEICVHCDSFLHQNLQIFRILCILYNKIYSTDLETCDA